MVIVEPSNVITMEKEGVYELTPYLERRGNWGFTVAVGASYYSPVNYEPNFLDESFESVYGSFAPMYELTFSVKRNLSFGSVGGEIGGGFYGNDSSTDAVESSLQLIPIRLGGVFYMDTLTANARFVPYVSGGAYIMLYKETQANASFNGNTQLAPYVRGGLAFGLDWLDKTAARMSYEDSGIQNTFAYIEIGKMFAGSGATDPDFEDTINAGAGFRIEF